MKKQYNYFISLELRYFFWSSNKSLPKDLNILLDFDHQGFKISKYVAHFFEKVNGPCSDIPVFINNANNNTVGKYIIIY